ncbi:TonB-dependent receptor [Aestuariicella hydrocarbonica]|uniref:TonB-dependent receptor n=1 Tax=Pseudomaricurvus hydrocarbonicus TaxID=1470433 RepID=A0A9E5MK73_9GAMM|nr:TonB-dependent receptor [Aestuariicella hydrocarbonica]NHO66114.1 TonB-dependent receptor [Aestuariicella hydrocarbonica]
MHNKKTRHALPLAIMMASGLIPLTASAEGVLEEVVVTAQKRSESLQDAPVAITAYSAESLESLGIDNMEDLTTTAPSLQSYAFPTSTNTVSLFIRGLGNLDSQTLTTDNPVGIYVDDVYIARANGAQIDLLDLERVEVLRGPQGTLYGRNSSAGAVKFISKKPADEAGVTVKASVGEFDYARLGITADLPISDSLRTKLSVMASSEDGWVENRGPNTTGGKPDNDFYAKDQSAIRLAVSWDISDNLTADYSYDYTDVDSTAQYYQSVALGNKRRDDTYNILTGGDYRYVLPEGNMEQQGHNLTVTAQLADNLTLKSISSYRDSTDDVASNWSDVIFFATHTRFATESFSQEFQLVGNAERLSYVAGLYYFSEDGSKSDTQYSNIDFGGLPLSTDVLLDPLASQSYFGFPQGTLLGTTYIETELQSVAAYGQVTYDMTDRLSLTLGLRYTEDDREAQRSGDNLTFFPGANDGTYDHIDWTAIADFAFTDSVNGYVKAATGFRSGGSSERAPNFAQTFAEEEVISYELGVKSELLNNSLRLNAALFRTETDNAINTIGGTGVMAAFQETFNFGEVKISGFELDALWALGTDTTLGLNYVYLDGELSDVVVPDESLLQIPGSDITDQSYLSQTPRHAFSLTFDHSFAIAEHTLDAHLDYSYRDEVYSSALGFKVNDLGQLNGRISLRDLSIGKSTMDIGLWGKNLTDEEETIYVLAGGGNQFNKPLSYGVDVNIRF